MSYSNNLLVPDDGSALGFARVTSVKEYEIGETRDDKAGNTFEYQEFADAVTYGPGQVLTWASTTCIKVTNDRSGGSSVSDRCAGICVGTPTATLKYGWMQTGGFHAAVKTNGDDDIAAGDSVIVSSTDGVCDSVAAATTTVHTLSFGHVPAVDVDASNTVGVVLQIK